MSHEEAVAIDTQLAALWTAADRATTHIRYAVDALITAIDDRPYNARKQSPLYKDEAVFKAQVLLAWGELPAWSITRIEKALSDLHAAQHDLYVARQQAATGEAIFNANPWSRFFLVQNTNGHIHSSMQCSTCFIDTQFGWLPQLSGLTEREAVEAHGSILCSICYPSAPVEWTNGISKVAQAEKDERAAAKRERDAAKAAKAITNPDGSPLRITTSGYTTEIKTLVTAQRELVGCFKDILYYGEGRPEYIKAQWEAATILANAIGHKTGDAEIEEILTKAEIKASQIVKKERG